MAKRYIEKDDSRVRLGDSVRVAAIVSDIPHTGKIVYAKDFQISYIDSVSAYLAEDVSLDDAGTVDATPLIVMAADKTYFTITHDNTGKILDYAVVIDGRR